MKSTTPKQRTKSTSNRTQGFRKAAKRSAKSSVKKDEAWKSKTDVKSWAKEDVEALVAALSGQ